MREKASMTVNVPSVGRAISSRQLLVPRSIAPYVWRWVSRRGEDFGSDGPPCSA